MFRLLKLLMLINSLAIYGKSTVAQTIDPHKLYESKCAICHESHAYEFVKNILKKEDYKLVGKRIERDINLILNNHRGTSLSKSESNTLITHFLGILKREGLYRQKCIMCHDSAVNLARHKLILRNGSLYDRYGGRWITNFLRDHGRLDESELIIITEMLNYQLTTTQPILRLKPKIPKSD